MAQTRACTVSRLSTGVREEVSSSVGYPLVHHSTVVLAYAPVRGIFGIPNLPPQISCVQGVPRLNQLAVAVMRQLEDPRVVALYKSVGGHYTRALRTQSAL